MTFDDFLRRCAEDCVNGGSSEVAPAAQHHADSGWRCLAGHYEGDWRSPQMLPPCIRCVCGEFVRPERWQSHVGSVGAARSGCAASELETVQPVRSMTIEAGVSGQPEHVSRVRTTATDTPATPVDDSPGIELFGQRVCRHPELGCAGSCRAEYACND